VIQPPNPLTVNTTDGSKEYRLGRAPLGGGGFGTVWRGRDHYDAAFAIKLITVPEEPDARDEAGRAFEREVEALRAVRHQNVVAYRAHGMVGAVRLAESRNSREGAEVPAFALVTDFVDGPTLRELIGPTGVSRQLLRGLIAEICAGLEAIHSRPAQLVHRDLKPQNIVISTRDQGARIVDFGLGRNPAADPLGQASAAAGTLMYMAPEQLRQSAITPQTDLYALALIAFELVSGSSAFGVDLLESVERRRAGSAPNSLAPLRLGVFDQFFRRALAGAPRDRFADVRTWFQSFDAIAAEAGSERHPVRYERARTTAKPIVQDARLQRWEDYREQFLKAIELEIVAVRADLARRGADKPLQARDLRRVDRAPDGAEYSTKIQGGLPIAEETPFRADVDGHFVNGHVIQLNPETGELRMWLEEDRGLEIDQALLQFDTTFLLERLADRLRQTPGYNYNIRLGLAVLRNDGTPGRAAWTSSERLNQSQEMAIQTALGSDVSYIWGPPGTGKTRTVAELVRALALDRRAVVIVAPTNVATDTVALATLNLGGAGVRKLHRDGLIIRFGETSKEIRQKRLDLDHAFEQTVRDQFPELVIAIDSLWQRFIESDVPEVLAGKRRRGAEVAIEDPLQLRGRFYTTLRSCKRVAAGGKSADGLQEVLSAAEALLSDVENAEHAALSRARLVFTTQTKLYLGGRLEGLMWDDAVVDEASMASPPTVVLTATVARERLVVAGDFMQLPPVVLSQRAEPREWLGRDVFVLAGVDGPDAIPSRCMLDEQYRMHPEISAVVSSVFYHGRLRDGESIRRTYPEYFGEHTPPPPANVLLVLDTTTANPSSEKPDAGSRRNSVHAALVADLIQAAANAGLSDLGVISPYVAQARLIRERVREVNPALLDVAEVATVHRFQGREKELVIFDTTDASPVPSGFLNDRKNPTAARLINVAISRARRRLIVVATAPWLQRQLTQQASVMRVLAAARARGLECDAEPWPGRVLGEFFANASAPQSASDGIVVGDWVKTAELERAYVRAIRNGMLVVLVRGEEVTIALGQVTAVLRDDTWRLLGGAVE
jgi:hypothetical protein